MKYIDILKIKYIKRLIKNKDYIVQRADLMATEVCYWKRQYGSATTNAERTYCIKMIIMYYKRFTYYINK